MTIRVFLVLILCHKYRKTGVFNNDKWQFAYFYFWFSVINTVKPAFSTMTNNCTVNASFHFISKRFKIDDTYCRCSGKGNVFITDEGPHYPPPHKSFQPLPKPNSVTLNIESSSSSETSGKQSVCFVSFWHNGPPPPVGQGLLIHEVSRSHTTTHHSR